MGRRSKKRRGPTKGEPKGGTPPEFHVRPFEALRGKTAEHHEEAEEPRQQTEVPPPPRSGPEEELLAVAMADVTPLNDRSKIPRQHRALLPKSVDEEMAVRDYLQDLVDGAGPFDIADTDEFIEGAVQGFDKRLIRKLRRGEYSIQDHIDLHGRRRDEARSEVARFIKNSSARGLRCVLIVHGRGLRSKDNIPVLKEKLKAWLTRGSIGARVLAFASARPHDGGAGAVYVLLRRQ